MTIEQTPDNTSGGAEINNHPTLTMVVVDELISTIREGVNHPLQELSDAIIMNPNRIFKDESGIRYTTPHTHNLSLFNQEDDRRGIIFPGTTSNISHSRLTIVTSKRNLTYTFPTLDVQLDAGQITILPELLTYAMFNRIPEKDNIDKDPRSTDPRLIYNYPPRPIPKLASYLAHIGFDISTPQFEKIIKPDSPGTPNSEPILFYSPQQDQCVVRLGSQLFLVFATDN